LESHANPPDGKVFAMSTKKTGAACFAKVLVVLAAASLPILLPARQVLAIPSFGYVCNLEGQ
jgi:hypothetical protein